MTIYLHASSLASKWGFSDGDLINDYLIDRETWCSDQHSLLERLVREYLLPKIPQVEVYTINTCHNPIRATSEWLDFCAKSNVVVEVSEEEVMRAFQEFE